MGLVIDAPFRCRATPLRGALGLLLALIQLACSDNGTGPKPPQSIDLDALFAPVTPVEVAAIEADWTTRSPAAKEVIEETSYIALIGGGLGTVRVFSHVVDGNRHYGATISPLGAVEGSLPVVAFLHGGDDGVNVDDVTLLLFLLGDRARDFVYVVPSFRSEPLIANGVRYTSEGAPSPWDRDVDDAIALLDVALKHVAEANSDRTGVLGFSRGGMVALLMALRDDRVDLVSELSGPTDFFDTWVRDLTQDALSDVLDPLPGIDILNEQFIQPMRFGSITPSEFRLELVRRSPVLWADRLPSVQIHHGTADETVPISQANRMIGALNELDRDDLEDEFHIYPGVGHDLLLAPAVDTRIFDFLERLRH